MLNKQYFTPEGLEKLKKKLDYLKKVRRKEIADRIKVAKELGDLSENAEYQDAKDTQAFNEGQILEVENVIRNAVVVDKNGQIEVVEIGNTVKVKTGEEEKEFMIVGSSEADPLVGKISNESPIGKSLLGKRKGEEVAVETPGGEMKYKILEIK